MVSDCIAHYWGTVSDSCSCIFLKKVDEIFLGVLVCIPFIISFIYYLMSVFEKSKSRSQTAYAGITGIIISFAAIASLSFLPIGPLYFGDNGSFRNPFGYPWFHYIQKNFCLWYSLHKCSLLYFHFIRIRHAFFSRTGRC